MRLLPLRVDILGQLRLSSTEQDAGLGRKKGNREGSTLLFQPLIQLLLGILQIHDALLGQFQVALQLPLCSLQVHAHLLLLFQGSLQLVERRTSMTHEDKYPDLMILKLSHSQSWGIPRDVQDLGKLPLSGPNVTMGLGECQHVGMLSN